MNHKSRQKIKNSGHDYSCGSCRMCSGEGKIHLQRIVREKLITEGVVDCLKCKGYGFYK